jgi:soluble P-type ATPase
VHQAQHRRWLRAVRVNHWAGSVVIEHDPGRRLHRAAVLELLDAAQFGHQHQAPPTAPPQLKRRAIGRLGVVGSLLGLELLVGLPALVVSAGLLPLLLGPLLISGWPYLRRGLLPPQSLDLLWFSSLLWRGETRAALVEYGLESGTHLLYGWSRSPRFSSELQASIAHALQQASVTCLQADGQWQPLPVARLCAGDLIRLQAGELLPTAALVVGGEAMVTTRSRDGDPGLVLVRAFQQLPAGVQLHSGTLRLKLQSGVERDRDLRGLRSQVLRRGELAPLDRPPRLVAQAQRLHQRSIPWLLLAGGGALVAGQPHAAAGLMQFDPGNDWQQCAAIVYGAAQRAAERLGVTLRRPEAIDPLARCRVVLISDAVLGSWSTRQLRALHDCDPWISRDRVIQILVGFRVRLRPCGLAPLRNLLLESDLDPAVVEDLEPLPPVGYRGRVDGVDFCIGGDALLRRLGLKPPESLPLAAGLDRLYLVQDLGQGRRVLAAADFELRLPRRVVRLFRRLRAMDCQIRVVCGWDTGLAQVASRRLGIPQEAVLMADSMAARVDLLQQLRRTSRAPVAFLGYAFSDAAALAAADVAIALDDGIVPFTSLLADLVIPSERLDRLADCLALARRARRLNRTNLALVAGPHLLALVLNLLRPLNPLVSILLTDLPLLAAELQTLVLLQEPTRHRA